MTNTPAMSPFRPHLLRAFYEWLVANGLTPHLVVNAELPGVRVPRQYVKDGQIVLNVAPAAVGQLQLGDADVSFSARFGGNPFAVRVPIGAVAAIYARENGAGTAFADEAGLELATEAEATDERPTLTAVEAPGAAAEAATGSDEGDEDEGGDEPPPPKKRGGGHLKVIK